MNYAQARSVIKSGDVLAWTHKGWSSWYDIQVQAIRVFTQSEYCHVGVAWVVAGRVFVIEAVSPQVRIYPLSKEVPFYWIPCGNHYWSDTIEELALSKVGDKYSKMDAIKAFFKKLTPGDNSVWQCAELVNLMLVSGGLFKEEVKATPSATVEELQKMDYPIYMVL